MLSKISFRRSIWSYSKVQKLMGNLIRNRTIQLYWKAGRIGRLKYVDIGCGPNAHENFINLDFQWHRKIDIFWDITRGLPFPNASVNGIFAEHCLEHFSLPVGARLLKEFRRILCRGGVLRLVVPDGELYLKIYNKQLTGDSTAKFPYQDKESFEGMFSPILSVNRIFYQDRESASGHRFIYDADILCLLLKRSGFEWVKKEKFGKGANRDLLIDTESRQCESLYLEAGVGRVEDSLR